MGEVVDLDFGAIGVDAMEFDAPLVVDVSCQREVRLGGGVVIRWLASSPAIVPKPLDVL
jgi:hypothetical protein